MSELNKENKKWLDRNEVEMMELEGINNYRCVHVDDVEQKLLEMQQEIKSLTNARNELSRQLSGVEPKLSSYSRLVETLRESVAELTQENKQLKRVN